jgi:homospermidine synthase
MSHFTTIKTQIVASEPLKKALVDLGLAGEEGTVEIRGYGGNRTRVDIRVPTRNPGYDIGFRKQGDAYELVADWWGIKDIKQDEFLQRLTQRYAYHVAKDQLEAQDFTVVEEEVQADNTIHITVRRMV